MAVKPVSKVLLSIEKAFQDEIITDSGLKFYIDPSYKKEWQVSVTAKIASLPVKYDKKYQKIIDALEVGDDVCVSFMVVSDFKFAGDGHRFMLTTEENDTFREYVNGSGYWVKVYALPGKISPIWVGVYQDNYMNIIDGIQGSQSQVETWLSQFPLGKTDIYTFNNFFEYDGKEYWECDLDQIFAKRVKGHLVAIGDRVICKPIEEIVPNEYLIASHQGHDVKMRYMDRGRVLSGGKEMGIKKDSIISFDPKYCEKYEFYGKQYFLINQRLVNGKWN